MTRGVFSTIICSLLAILAGNPLSHRPSYTTPEELEETKGVMKIRNSKKDRQHNSQKKKDKRTNNNLQNITQKTIDE
jgi:hypothetical protein